MAYSGTSHSEVIAAGAQSHILLLNVDRGTVVKHVPRLQYALTVGTDDGDIHETTTGTSNLWSNRRRKYRHHRPPHKPRAPKQNRSRPYGGHRRHRHPRQLPSLLRLDIQTNRLCPRPSSQTLGYPELTFSHAHPVVRAKFNSDAPQIHKHRYYRPAIRTIQLCRCG
jgi:hypothetical protein